MRGLKSRSQRGVSLIELMVGIAIGMIVVAGASVMAVNQIAEHRRLALEIQLQQDLRAASDLMLKELRRAGSWAVPLNGVWASGAAPPLADPYSSIAVENGDTNASKIVYHYSRNTDRSSNNNNPEDNNAGATETFGFQLNNGVLQLQMGTGNWQPLTDPNTLTVTALSIRQNLQTVDLIDYCTQPCPTGSSCTPQLQVRRFDITLTGQAVHDAAVVRTITVSSRVRTDDISGSCPT
jgi:type IV pilus assembly protein PilW